MGSLPQPPLVPGSPIIGSALKLFRDPLRYFVTLYRQNGPVFRIRVLSRTYTVLAGIEANQFMARDGDEHLSSEYYFGGFGRELGTETLLLAIDGPRHKRRRKLHRRSYSHEAIIDRLPEMTDIARRFIGAWEPGKRIAVFPAFQRIVLEQLGMVLANHTPSAYFDDLLTVMRTNIYVNVMKLFPAWVLRRRAYVKAKARVLQLGHEIIAEHRGRRPGERTPDLVDALLAERDDDGQPLPDTSVIGETIGSYNAGMDTVSNTCSFMLYGILRTPGLLPRVVDEVDRVFSGTPGELRVLVDLPVLHGAAMETMRLYPVAPFMPRLVVRPFDFAGHRVDQGAEVFMASTVTHHLAEYFPHPERFDVDRYGEGRSWPPNAFAPFALGAHSCLGAGLAEVQIVALIATVLHAVELELDPPTSEVKVRLSPTPTPGAGMAVRLIRHRRDPARG